jgi:N-acetylmuramate 1-kinase
METMTRTEDRNESRMAFLERAGWAAASAAPLAGDASTRSYQRLRLDGRPAVLMIAPPGAEAPACPPDADEAARRALGYNAMARLAGPNLDAFTTLSAALREAGLSAPEVYAADAAAGYALLEDLGDDLFARVVGLVDEEKLYRAAIEALATLHAHHAARPSGAAYQMLDYDALAFEAEAALLIEWYWPLKKGAPAPDDLVAEYLSLWRDALKGLSAPHVYVLRDYHAENLLWLPDRRGVQRVGVIDFQDALFGHAAYDLVSLLEDARRDVDPDLAEEMAAHYMSFGGPTFDRDGFRRDYAILAAQRNAKILGIFARLAKRDNKPRYLDLLPRVEGHFRRDLARPDLAPLRTFFAKHLPDLAA